jgi:DNA polymerase III epsilon subunit-like protein
VNRISDATFVVVDVETTGLDFAGGDRVVEVAAKTFCLASARPSVEFSTLVNPERSIPPSASGVHHLTDEDVTGAPLILDAIGDLVAGVGLSIDHVLCAHNAPFDRAFLECGLTNRVWLDTKRLAQHLLPNEPEVKNQTLRYVFGGKTIDLGGIPPHRALADVRVTAFILGKLLDLYLKLGYTDDIVALLEFTASPIEYQTIRFGKFRGLAFSDPKVDMGWLQWAWKNPGKDDSDLRFTLEKEAARRKACGEAA